MNLFVRLIKFHELSMPCTGMFAMVIYKPLIHATFALDVVSFSRSLRSCRQNANTMIDMTRVE